VYKVRTNSQKKDIKDELTFIDLRIDQRDTYAELLFKRKVLMKALQEIDHLAALEIAQKSKLDMEFPNILSTEQTKDLEKSVSIEEIKQAVWDCAVDKSPGPDGFTFGFYQRTDLSLEVVILHLSALIPKLQDAKMVKDFRPITKKQTMIFKVDFEKAYDSVRWDYLDVLMKKFGFGVRWWYDVSNGDDIVSKVKAHLSKWKMKTLSIRGRLTLLKLVLASIPIYHLSMFKVPAKVLHTMESIRTHFFNGVENNEKKMVWVSWPNVLASKHNGGLGISSFYALNGALMFKWVWRFRTQDSSLWSRVISAIHVGNGKNSLFWDDVWMGDTTLKEQYPRVYALETCKSISVANKLAHSSVEVSLRRPPRGGVELHQYNSLSSRLDSIQLPMIQDRWVWSLDGTGEFTTTFTRKLIDDKRLPKVSYNTRWIKAILINVNVFTWRVGLNKLPTRLNLSMRGLDIDSISCPLCDDNVESTSHLFFSCPMVKDVLRKISMWCDIAIPEVYSYDQWLS
ncbi:RNA-directed DNA polymerase, eukaryota, reverse transcriptase zinc-binding domain protein, partial [Tanacetum coccineum]